MTPRFLSYTFPAGNTTDVCALQTLAGAGALTLNGNLVNSINGVMSFINYGYSRSLSYSSTSDNSGIEIVVTGLQNGVGVTETTVDGPNDETLYGTVVFDTITSVTVNGAITGTMSVGSGYTGFFPLIQVNLYEPVVNYTLSVTNLVSDDDAGIGVFGTLQNLSGNRATYATSIALPSVKTIEALGANAPYFYSNAGNPTYNQLLVQVGSSDASITYAMQMNYIQV